MRDDPRHGDIELGEGDGERLPEGIMAWAAVCPSCGHVNLTMLTKAEGPDVGPWTEIQGRSTRVDEQHYYCSECRTFIDLKDPSNWRKATA